MTAYFQPINEVHDNRATLFFHIVKSLLVTFTFACDLYLFREKIDLAL
jgi:hypothetical protein